MNNKASDRLLAAVSILAVFLIGFLYLQTCYAAWLECPNDKIDMQLIPRCAE